MSAGHLKRLTSIVAIDRNGAIGAHNALPWRLKSDLSYFKRTTSGNTVIMGRKTFESIGQCLPNRANLILSHNFELFPATNDCRVALSVSEAIYRAETNPKPEVFVVGGAMTYQEFDHLVDRYLVTFVDHNVSGADAFLAAEIRDQWREWTAVEQHVFPIVEGKDEFASRVVELIPPDAQARQERRREIYRAFFEQIRAKPTKHSKRGRDTTSTQQLSFI